MNIDEDDSGLPLCEDEYLCRQLDRIDKIIGRIKIKYFCMGFVSSTVGFYISEMFRL